jgi:hypothetical protein
VKRLLEAEEGIDKRLLGGSWRSGGAVPDPVLGRALRDAQCLI